MSEPSTGMTLTLRGGTPVLLRPVDAGDFHRLKQGVQQMSQTSRYMRFFSFLNQLSDEQARYFTQVDQVNHVAWCAVEPSPQQQGYGLARFVREAPHEPVANFAVAIIDRMQGRGLGTLLLAAIYLRAQQVGLEELQGEMLPDNPIMPMLMPRLGGSITSTDDPACRLIRWPVLPTDQLPNDTPTARQFIAWLRTLAPVVTPPPS